MGLLTEKESQDYRKIFRRHFLATKKNRELSHILAWDNHFRSMIILSHSRGWWTKDIKEAILAEIMEIEKSVKR